MLIKIISIVLLVDSFFAIVLAVFGKRWYMEYFQVMSRWLPLALSWTIWYFVLAVWIALLTFGVVG